MRSAHRLLYATSAFSAAILFSTAVMAACAGGTANTRAGSLRLGASGLQQCVGGAWAAATAGGSASVCNQRSVTWSTYTTCTTIVPTMATGSVATVNYDGGCDRPNGTAQYRCETDGTWTFVSGYCGQGNPCYSGGGDTDEDRDEVLWSEIGKAGLQAIIESERQKGRLH